MEENQMRYFYEMFDTEALIIYYSKCLNWCKLFDKWIQIIVSFISIIGISVLQAKFSNSEFWFYSMIALQITALILSLFFDTKNKTVKLELLLIELNSLYVKMSDEWYKISNGLLTSNEIHNLWISIKSQKSKIDAPTGIIGWFWYLDYAEKQALAEFNKYYPTGDKK